ncbi:MAG TPA: hypothetical protein VFY18_02500 [Candidatus Limnocylindrales bacterium]|nr:hypothetical protein [Candidatus Limnocylindrales bacterium]
MTDRTDARIDFDGVLVDWLEDVAPDREPADLLDRVLETTAVTSRRPAWWRPGGPVAALRPPQVVIRTLAVAAVLVLLLLALTLALTVGSHLPPLREYGPLVAARHGELLIVDLSGSIERRIPTGQLMGTGVWSRDGTRLAHGDGTAERPFLVIADRNLDEVVRIPLPAGAVPTFSWAPDGRRIAFGVQSTDTIQVDVVDVAAGAVPVPITDPAIEAVAPSWSPDGSLIVFRAGTAFDQQALYVARPDGTGLRRLTVAGGGVVTTCGLTWSPNARTIVFETGNSVSTVDVDGASEQQILRFYVSPHCPTMSPDGRRIAVSVSWTQIVRVQVVELDRTIISDTSVEHPFHEIPGLESDVWPAVWSPDGRVIVVNGRDLVGRPQPRQFADPDGIEPARTFFIDDAIVVDWQRLAP